MPAHNPTRVLTVCCDAGGARSVQLCAAHLRQRADVVLDAVCAGHSSSIFDAASIPNRRVGSDFDMAAARQVLQETRPNVLLTATSFDARVEGGLMRAAHKADIPAVAFVDYWAHYRERFCVGGEAEDTLHIPDYIAVIDEVMRSDMLALGFPDECLRVTGSPALDAAAVYPVTSTAEDRQHLRRTLGVGPDDLLVMFASNPLGQSDWFRPEAGKQAEHLILPLIGRIQAALARIAEKSGRRIHLLVRPHPRESECQFESLVSGRVSIQVTREASAHAQIMAADVVLGAHSILLVEACCMGSVVVSFETEGLDVDMLPTNRTGRSLAVLGESDMADALERSLLDQDYRLRQQQYPPPAVAGATQRLAELVFEASKRKTKEIAE